MKPGRWTVAVAVAVVLLTGCASQSPGSPSPQSSEIKSGSTVSVQVFAAAAKEPGTVILDVRRPEEFAAGHLEGALNFNVEDPGFTPRVAALDKTRTYAVYCRSANRSKVAMEVMTGAGFTRVFDLEGGINAWQESGGKVVTGP